MRQHTPFKRSVFTSALVTVRNIPKTKVLNQNGLEYPPENIDGLLLRRHENKKLLRAGKHPKGAPKRAKEQDTAYKNALEKILQLS